MAAIRWLDVGLRGAQPNLPQRYESKKKPGMCRAFCVLEGAEDYSRSRSSKGLRKWPV